MTNKKNLILFIFLWFCLLFTGYAQSEPQETEGITLTWQDFRELLGLDTGKIKITWSEFRKLMAQTGNQMNMDIQLKDGLVTLTREQFRQILGKMRPTVGKIPPPPRQYLVSEARYEGAAGENNCRFNASFKIYLFRQESPGYINIPIVSTQTALANITVDGVPAVIHTSGSWHSITLSKSGFHQVQAVFSISHNRQSLYLPVVGSIINQIDFTLPKKDFEITIPASLNSKTTDLSNGMRLTASMPVTNQIQINWNRKMKEREKKPALFYAETHSLITAASDIIKVKSTIDLEILQHSLDNISLLVPKGYEVIKVDAQSINNWHVRETDIGRTLEVYFGYDISSDFNFTVYTERILAAETLGVDYSGLQVIDARRERGSIGVVADSSVEVQVQAGKELEKQEFHQLPQRILSMSSRPILYAFKYAKHPFSLDIAIDKHERLEGISTVIESADAVLLFLEEGKVIVKIIYTIRNSFKQFMELELPENFGIWTVLVDNKREKASLGEKGKVLIPLVRSPGNGEELKAFNVELIYTLPLKKFGFSGTGECVLPGCDIFINKIRMAMFLPDGFSYNFHEGEWKEEELIKKKRRDISKLKPSIGEAEEDKLQTSAETGDTYYVDGVDTTKQMEQDEKSGERLKADLSPVGGVPDAPVAPGEKPAPVVPGVIAESLPSGRDTGKIISEEVLLQPRVVTGPAGLDSINVHLPLSGIKYLFTKKIINKDEKYPLKFSYFNKNLQTGVFYLVIVLVFTVLLILLVRWRKRRKKACYIRENEQIRI